ncbi:hypothetical protein EDB92DRAFT_1947307 [Lactarius akahatsu]|uniref:Uncharacterized protein n=1 Tax=Lactarius akahatsu TaxID=416441 RepID=A0AAD4LER3_9AGAM|nr:hypothetical protein EDB92DRAFT_1947307 [Lactarius akahatsu]
MVGSNKSESLEGIPLPAENVAMQGLIQDPHHLPPPHDYEAAYHQLHADYLQYMHMQQDERVAQGVPGHPQAIVPVSIDPSSLSNVILTLLQEAQENHDGIFGHAPADPAVGPPQYFPGPEPLPYQGPQAFADAPPADGLRNLVGRYINSPGIRINTLRIEPGLAGHFEVWIVLDMANIL